MRGRRPPGSSDRTGSGNRSRRSGRLADAERGASAAAAATDSARQEGVDYSGTNVQETGVDEPDIVKTNGETLFAIANGRLNAVDVSGAKPRLLDTLQLDARLEPRAPAARRPAARALARRLLARAAARDGGASCGRTPRRSRSCPRSTSRTRRSSASSARSRSTAPTSRRGSSAARRASSSPRRFRSPCRSCSRRAGPRRGRRSRQSATAPSSRRRGVAKWLPTYRIKRPGAAATNARPLVQCRDVRRPASFSGLGMLTVLTVDLDKGLDPVDSVAVMTDAPDRLRIAGEPLRRDRALGRPARSGPADRGADRGPDPIHAFDISSPTKTMYRGTRQRVGLPAQPVVAVGVRRRAARRQHRDAGVVGRRRRLGVVPDDARLRDGALVQEGASAASARASVSTPCGSPATPATSSRSARSTRSTRSTSRTRPIRACSASSRSPATRRTCTRSPTTC